MAGRPGIILGVAALAIYIIGGIATFGGAGLVVFMKGRDLMGLGDGRTIGYLLVCVGVCLSLLGVLFMRIFRNRGLS